MPQTPLSPPPRVAAILPARWGSTRFPGKPLHPIAGKPLIRHVWERARQARLLSRVIIATDDERIAAAARAFGAEVAMTSPDHPSGTDRIAEVARTLPGVTHLLNIQGDEPLIDPALLDRLAQTLIDEPALEMATTANRFGPDEDPANPNAVKVVVDAAGNALYFSRSLIPFRRDSGRGGSGDGDAEPPFLRHHGLYGYSLPFLLRFVRWPPSPLERAEALEQLRALENGAKIRVLLTGHASVGVDTPADVATVEKQLAALSGESAS